MGNASLLYGELDPWPELEELVAILEEGGLRVKCGRYSVRVLDCDHFLFSEYGGDLGSPRLEADARDVESMLSDGQTVSDALSAKGVRHRFEIYDSAGHLVAYLHHGWPASQLDV